MKVDFKYTKNQQQKPKNRSQNIIWFNSQFKNAVSRNAAEIFLLDISFTNVPLDYTLNIILKWIEVQRELETKILIKEMKYVLLICTKNVLFSLDNKLYTQKDDIAMESPVGSVITGIYIVDFEKNVIPQS